MSPGVVLGLKTAQRVKQPQPHLSLCEVDCCEVAQLPGLCFLSELM